MNKFYKKNVPATVLCLIKLLEGILAACVLVQIAMLLGASVKVIREMAQATHQSMLASGWEYFIENSLSMDGSSAAVAEEILQGIGSIGNQILIGILVMTLAGISGWVLMLIDAIGAALVRFSNKGAALVQVVHVIYAVLRFILLGGIAVAFGSLVLKKDELAALVDEPDVMMVLWIVLTIVFIVLLIGMLMAFCYHKDVAQQMSFISRDLAGNRGYLKKNHLSGLSIWFALGNLLCVVFFVYAYSQGEIETTDNIVAWIPVVYFGIGILKYLCVAACNRGLKKYAK